MPLTMKHTASAVFGASMLLAGCGGPQASSGAFSPGTTPMQSAARPMDRQGCQNDGGVQVDPCRIRFTSAHPGPQDVTVTSGGDGDSGHAIVERDDCTARNVATVTKDMNRIFTVTAGSATGSCTAFFSDRNGRRGPDDGDRNRNRGQNGAALRIVNEI